MPDLPCVDNNMLRQIIFSAIAITCGSSYSAFADCPVPLERFGDHPQPPAPIRPPPVDNTYGHFSFGSDIWTDPDTHAYFSWNFIRNDDAQGLAISWDKAGIDQTSAPIAAGHNTCTFNPLAEQSPALDFPHYIDHDAPIIYSSATKEQKAWVYREPDQRNSSKTGEGGNRRPEDWLKHIFSRFATTYVDTVGKNHNIDVTIASAYTSDNLKIQISTITPELTLGIANLPELLWREPAA